MTRRSAGSESLLDELAPLVDGEKEALARHEAELARDEGVRDLVHDAGRTADAVGNAGSDYRPPADLEHSVLAALDARPVTVVETPKEHAGAPAKTTRGDGVPHGRVGRGAALLATGVVLGGLAAVAGVTAVVAPRLLSSRLPDVVVARASGWSGELVQVAPSDDVGGVLVRPPSSPAFTTAERGASIEAGTTVRTDDRTRARLELADGTSLVLDHGTELSLGREERTARIVRGRVFADVAHDDSLPHAHLLTSTADVEIVGTKLVVSVVDDTTHVRVTQGRVRIHAGGSTSEVVGGFEGIAAKNELTRVVPSSGLASAMRFAELAPENVEEGTPGLGELRARKPGERTERERPLTLAEHVVRVRVAGPIARTEIEETFKNDSGDVLEGVYRFPLPRGARIASLALEVDGRFEEGAFVARERAAQIFRGVIRHATPVAERRTDEEYVWIPGPWRDPALLEWQKGGRFELRIFPIPAHGARRVRIAYEENVETRDGERRYVYPLPSVRRGDARVGRFSIDARVSGADRTKPLSVEGYAANTGVEGDVARAAFDATSFAPTGDLAITYRLPDPERELRYYAFQGRAVTEGVSASDGDAVVRAETESLARDDRGYVVFAVKPTLPTGSSSVPTDYAIVVDTSQSMTGALSERARVLATALVSELDRRHRVNVLACDLTCRPAFDAPTTPGPENAAKVRAFLEEIRPAGSSDVVASLRDGIRALGRNEGRARAILYVGDGQSTRGATTLSAIARDTRRLAENDLAIGTVGIGADADARALDAIARIGGGHHVSYAPGESALETALAVLETTYGASLVGATLELPPGVTAVAPASLPNARTGAELLVAARFSGEVAGDAILRGTVGGRPYERRFPVRLTRSSGAANAFVPRVWAEKTIGELELESDASARPKIVALSKSYGVMSRDTSLLVLESEAMFRAYGIDRPSPALAWSGDEEVDESVADAAGAGEDADRAEEPELDAFGDLGTSSTRAGSGRASGAGAGFAATERSASPAPAMRARAPSFDRSDDGPRDARREAPSASAATGSAQAAPTSPPMPRVIVPPPPPVLQPPGGRWMRKVWFREGHVASARGPSSGDLARIATAESRLVENRDSRDRQLAFVKALLKAGDLDRASTAIDAWLARDPNDVEAIVASSDVAGRRGNRDEALRILSGVVDAEPGTKVLHERLALAFERVGKPGLACAERRAIGDLAPSDAEAVGASVRCLRVAGDDGAATDVLSGIADGSARARVALAASNPTSASTVRGDLVLEAHWDRATDLDLTLVAPDGTRLSLLGGKSGISIGDANSSTLEELALRGARVGDYVVEIARTTPGHEVVRGTVRVRAFGETRMLPFTLEGDHATIGRIEVVRRWRLEPR